MLLVCQRQLSKCNWCHCDFIKGFYPCLIARYTAKGFSVPHYAFYNAIKTALLVEFYNISASLVEYH